MELLTVLCSATKPTESSAKPPPSPPPGLPPSPPQLSPSEKRKARREARIEKRRAKREREAKKLAKARQEARKAERREAKKARKARQAEDARRRRALRQAKRILVKRGWVPRDAEVNTTMLRSELQKARTENKPAKVSTLTRMLASVEPANESFRASALGSERKHSL